MPDHPSQPNADEREGVTRRHLLVGALVVFLPILVLGIAGAYVGYKIPRMAIDRQGSSSTQSQVAPAPSSPAPVDEASTAEDSRAQENMDNQEEEDAGDPGLPQGQIQN